MGVLVQVIASLLLSLSCLNMGISCTWPSSTVLLFKSENTTLHRPMTNLEISLFSSLPLIGSIVGHPLIVLGVLDKLGLKRTTILISLLYVIGWSLIAFCNRVEAILIAVAIIGVGYVIFMQVSIYISEISQDSIRGTLVSVPNLSIGVGYLMSYLLGGVLEYHIMVYCCLSLAVIGTVFITVLKEPPVNLMIHGKEEEAAQSIAFYRHTSTTSKEVFTELNNIRLSLKQNLEDAQSLTRVVEEPDLAVETKVLSCWQLFKTTPSIRRQFYLVMMLYNAYVYQGFPSVQTFAEPVFTAVVGDMISPSLCSVLLGILTVVAGCVGAYLIDAIGRRPLQIYSSLMCGICCLFIGTQIITEWFPKWITLIIIYAYCIFHYTGSGTVPYVVIAEIFLPEVKSKLFMITTEWSYICFFSCMFLFSYVVQSVGLAPMFYLFSAVSFVSTVYFFYFLPETKGLPMYAIQALFTEKVK